MNTRSIVVIIAISSVLLASNSFAFLAAGKTWPGANATFYTNHSGTIPANQQMTAAQADSAFAEATLRWNNLSGFQYATIAGVVDPCATNHAQGTSTQGWGFSSTFCGTAFGSSTLGVTLIYSNPVTAAVVDADILFNSAKIFDVHPGNQNGPAASCVRFIGQPVDFTRVAAHELGHALGLDHEATNPALMNPVYSECIQAPQTDDINGLVSLYGFKPNDTKDFNGDGNSDILWRHTNGTTVMWLMNGSTLLSANSLGTVPPDWSIAGLSDFNGDGKEDILWHHSSGITVLWLMNGSTRLSATSLGVVPTSWSIIGTADFNGDGKGDILWRHNSGVMAQWFMNGAAVQSSGSPGAVPTSWAVADTADFNGDGKADILWRHSSGITVMWLMNGSAILSGGSLGTVPVSWSIAGTADFDGDGKSDILWHHSSGVTALWLMNGTTQLSGTGLGVVPPSWTIIDTADFSGDGKGDILWRHSSGVMSMWLMNGATIQSSSSPGSVPTAWNVQ